MATASIRVSAPVLDADAAHAQIWRGAATRGLATVGGRVLALVATVLVVRTVGTTASGHFFFIMSAVWLLALPFGLGLPQSSTKTIAHLNGMGRTSEAAAVARGSIRAVTTVGVSLVCASVVVWVFFDPGPLFLLVPVLAAALATQSVATSIFRARGRIAIAESTQVFVLVAFIGLLVIPGAIVTGDALVTIRTALEFGAAGALAIGVLVGSRGSERVPFAPLIMSALPYLLIGAAWLALQNADVFALGVVSGSAAVGLYFPILRAADVAVVVHSLVNAYILPAAAALNGKGSVREVNALYRDIAPLAFAVTAPFVLPLILAPDLTIHILFGVSGPAVAPTARILAVGYCANAVLGLGTGILQAVGTSRELIRVSAALFATAAVAAAVLVPALGIQGAGYATSIGFIVLNGGTAFVLWRRYGIWPLRAGYVRTLATFALATFATLASRIATRGTFFAFVAVLAVSAATGAVAWRVSRGPNRRAVLGAFAKT